MDVGSGCRIIPEFRFRQVFRVRVRVKSLRAVLRVGEDNNRFDAECIVQSPGATSRRAF